MIRDLVYQHLYDVLWETTNPQVAIYKAMDAMKFNRVEELDDDFHEWLSDRGLVSPVARRTPVSKPGKDYVRIAPNFYMFSDGGE